MKICFLQYDLSGGGAERKICTLANYFASKGHTVHIGMFKKNICVYNLDKKINLTYICRDTYYYKNFYEKFVCSAEVYAVKFSVNLLNLLQLKNLSNKIQNKFNIVFNKELPLKQYLYQHKDYIFITMMPDTFAEIMTVAEKYSITEYIKKYIVMECNNPLTDTNKLLDLGRKKYYPFAKAIVTMSLGIKNRFDHNIKNKIFIIPNPLRDDITEPYFNKRNKTIVTYCRLNKQKNLPLLINAFAKLSKEYGNYRLEIYGKGFLKDALLQQIKDLDISDRAFIFDFDPHIHEKVKKSAMFVMSSDYEGQPNGLMEAMAIGLPCISADCDFGPRDMIRDHENGLLVPCNDADALYNAMKEFIDNPALAEKCGREAIKVREEYSVRKIGDKWLKLTEKICKGN